MRIILAGTPEFSVPIFEKIIQNFNVVAIVSQPDRPANRNYKLQPTPTKLLAQKYNIHLFQPNKISEIYDELVELKPDLLLTCAFGQYIPQKVLDIPKYALNIHGSLLPKYRGAAPIQYSLLNGDTQTGISLMFMTKQMDAGDVIFQAKLDIDLKDTSDSLFVKMCDLATQNITHWLNKIAQDDFTHTPQNPELVTLSPKLLKEDAQLDLTRPLNEIFNKIRAFSSNPGAYTFIDNKRVKIYYASLEVVKNALKLECADGVLYATDYQFESKKRIKLS
ncbi:methionyl-tRNA formyltransferase [Mycoplasmopsis pullorum]|uniref:methionyl-tRNA formyltransferase n=1 Tax=Mycoplasmopsis pullorum TaxID=48003 RepID=UPI001117B390|nr:methionyl-tRNA formyltransferase [Mycoplasmopsis pullorum]TNK81970.1 methionyl-tRNA formyltransferase [Mycoplasmopsis pullorum]TNK83387.1 methionyl-tRNA formyltransferase [Mycoplasmopsis pullorum]TNK85040.1 methionyl-tRNA formyltransferase [Mycoplasmopsis pullorum]TNK85284.1 methionyl-tRNA formyltransferase [Mycoplasmopsis pullorum]TNK86177.1 methionyl-tRNA formyltransferase [Mycoplasmopsis pullorum]